MKEAQPLHQKVLEQLDITGQKKKNEPRPKPHILYKINSNGSEIQM